MFTFAVVMLFGLSVFGILVCIFSVMSHEKMRKYLERLEIRRRFAEQRARRPPPPSPLSPTAHNRCHSARHAQYCNCAADDQPFYPNGGTLCPPPLPAHHLDGLFDSRPHYDDCPPLNGNSNNGTANRSHSWFNYWLRCLFPDPNARVTAHSSAEGIINRNNSNSRGFFRSIFSRRRANQNGGVHSGRETQPRFAPNSSLRWRSMDGPNGYFPPPHVWIPRMGSSGVGLSTLPSLFPRENGVNHYNLRGRLCSAMNAATGRRTRSNDGIFHHLNLGLPPHALDYMGHYSLGPHPPSVFALWGPPPPYTMSQPQSLNSFGNAFNGNNCTTNNCGDQSRNMVGHHIRETSVHSADNHHQSSKMSTPISERRKHCNAFSSQGIRLTIGANDGVCNSPMISAPKTSSKGSCIVEIHVPYDEELRNRERHRISMNAYRNTGNNIREIEIFDEFSPDITKSKLINSDDINVSVINNNNISNTLPNIKRNVQNQQKSFNPFTSLSNIPLTFPINSLLKSDRLNAKNHNQQSGNHFATKATPVNANYDRPVIGANRHRLSTVCNIFCNTQSTAHTPSKPSSLSMSSTPSSETVPTTTSSTDELITSNTDNTGSMTSTAASPAVSLPVDPPTDYKSTLIIHTPNHTHSSPITDATSANVAERQLFVNGVRVNDLKLNFTQSMPNINCVMPASVTAGNGSRSTTTSTTSSASHHHKHSHPQFWDLHRIPSSGDTSTSQDFADFELELDDEPVKFAADLPRDSEPGVIDNHSPMTSSSCSLTKLNTTSSVTPEIVQPPTPFNNRLIGDQSTTATTTSSSATGSLSSRHERLLDNNNIIVNIKSIQV